MRNEHEMTEKQRRFVEAYVGEAKGNATEAARMAGYSDAENAGKQNKRKETIQEAITNRLQEAVSAGDIPDATEVLRLLGDHARASMGDFLDVTGRTAVVNMSKAEEAGKLHLLKEVEFGKGGIKIKLQDQQAALQMLGRYHKLFTDKVEHDFSKLSDAELLARIKGTVGGGSTPGADAPG